MQAYQSSEHEDIFSQSVDSSHAPSIPSRGDGGRGYNEADEGRDEQSQLLSVDDGKAIVGIDVGHGGSRALFVLTAYLRSRREGAQSQPEPGL
jgi:hypothetical protein